MDMSARIFGLLDGLFGRRPRQDSGWQRERTEQETGAIQLPNIITDIAGGRPWPGPAGTWRSVYLHEPPHRHREPPLIPSPCAAETDAFPRLPPVPRAPGDPRALADIETGRGLPGLPKWVLDRVQPAHRAEIAANTQALDDVAQTIADQPTWIAVDQQVEKILARSQPLPDQSWLTADIPELAPLSEQSLSSADRTAISNLFEITEADCEPDLEISDLTEQRAAVDSRRRIETIIEQMKTESEQ